MGLTSNTGLLATDLETIALKPKSPVELRCEVSPAPFVLRPFADLYNPFSCRCSVLCNHPADTVARDVVKKAKDSRNVESKTNLSPEELAAYASLDNEKPKPAHDIVTEDMFRRYTDTDSRPLTPAPTLASGKSRGSRRCLTPDQMPQRTLIVLDLRRSHSQETLYYRGYTTSELTSAPGASTIDSALPSVQLTDSTHGRLLQLRTGPCEQLPPLASPLVLSKRAAPLKEVTSSRSLRKNQLKALNLNKPQKKPKAGASPAGPRSGREAVAAVEGEAGVAAAEGEAGGAEESEEGEGRRRGRRRRRGRPSGDRLTSAGLAAQSAQDPETQIAGIGSDSHNPSSRASIALTDGEDGLLILPVLKVGNDAKKIHSFLDDDILKYLHREVDQNAIETEFDTKRRYVLEEALRTRPERPRGQEMQALLREMEGAAVGLADWLHIPRVFSRRNAQFSLPLDSHILETLTPMKYAARYVTLKRSKQLLYLTVLQRFRPAGYNMPVQAIPEALTLMMGGILKRNQVEHLSALMEWESYEEELNFTDDIKLKLTDGRESIDRSIPESPESPESGDGRATEERTMKYRSWCGVCAVCERMYGRFNSRGDDPPDGMELSDFSMLETKLAVLKLDSGLVEILNTIRSR